MERDVKINTEEALKWWINLSAFERIRLEMKYVVNQGMQHMLTNEEKFDIWIFESFKDEENEIIACSVDVKPKSTNFVDELKHYFATTSREKVLSDWNETAEFDNVGSGINEPIEINQFKYVWLDLNTGEFSNSWSEEQYPNAIDEEMLKTATYKHWKLIK